MEDDMAWDMMRPRVMHGYEAGTELVRMAYMEDGSMRYDSLTGRSVEVKRR